MASRSKPLRSALSIPAHGFVQIFAVGSQVSPGWQGIVPPHASKTWMYGVHVPPTQAESQQSFVFAQRLPWRSQLCAPQRPSSPQAPEQHSAACLQATPNAAQPTGATHVPPPVSHLPSQHSPSRVHAAPGDAHTEGAHCPELQ